MKPTRPLLPALELSLEDQELLRSLPPAHRLAVIAGLARAWEDGHTMGVGERSAKIV